MIFSPHKSVHGHVLVSAIMVVALLAGCGGGGGSGTTVDPPSASKVAFTGFSFRIGSKAASSVPPFENTTAVPPSLGAPLDVTIIFEFTGAPQGPFTQANLPVYTTSAEVNPSAFPPLGQTVIAAKGKYVAVGSTVEFRPFVPTQPLQVKLSAPAAAVPGLLPASVYTAQVSSTNGEKLTNLLGAGGTVKFGTTSNPAAYYAVGSGDGKAPSLLASLPVDGTTGFYPGVFSNYAPGSSIASFPDGPKSITLSYDRAVLPTVENLNGKDWDGDGITDPSFFLRTRATSLLVGAMIPAFSSIGNTLAFPSISGLSPGSSVAVDGSDIVLHNSKGSGALAGANPALIALPGSLATGSDPSLLWVILKVGDGNDKLTVVDQILGDASYCQISSDAAIDTGLDDVVGLTTLQSGRLIAFDRTTRRIYELLANVTRHRPAGEPELASPTGDGMASFGFISEPFPNGVDILDLAQTPSGSVLALAENGSAFPVILHLLPIDPDLNGEFLPTDGNVDNSIPAILLGAAYASIECTSDSEFFALNRSSDSIDVLSATGSKLLTVVNGVAAYGINLASLPDGLSPACSLAIGFMEMDAGVTVQTNGSTGAILEIVPKGILPIGADVSVMQRNSFSALNGVSAANEDPSHPVSVLGSTRLLTVSTSAPSSTVGACTLPDPDSRVNDVYQEEFLDSKYEDTSPPTLSPQADWAKLITGSTPSGSLRALAGASDQSSLGDFQPAPFSDFDPSLAYPIGSATLAHFAYVFLDTDAQAFPLPNGATPGVTTSATIGGGKFTFRDFIIPEGVWVVARGSNPLQITATGMVEIRGVLDVSGTNGIGDETFDSGYIPVPGGAGGPGGGRGGNGHPTLFDPNGPGTLNQYVTPETGERGLGPVIGTGGGVVMASVGGHGGRSTLGADFSAPGGYPVVGNTTNNSEFTRPPGGGGGTFYFHGMYAHSGTGGYVVQSNSTWFPFSLCPINDKIRDALYGNDENRAQGLLPSTPLQCVYLLGTPDNPNYFLDGGAEGDGVFVDADPSNDFIGEGGELPLLIGGQGGGGGGSRIDSNGHENNALLWAGNNLGDPIQFPPLAPPFYPSLGGGTLFFSPTLFDAKGGGGGGGGGSVMIRTLGAIRISRSGHINAYGGAGEGGEAIKNSNYAGGGGGGSGGAVILQAAGDILIEADANHKTPYFTDKSGAQGASIDVSGGYGKDAVTTPIVDTSNNKIANGDWARSDGGQGGFGLIQLQAGGESTNPLVQQGAFLFARVHNVLKLGTWTGDTGKSKEHPSWNGSGNNKPPDILRYIDILEYRYFLLESGTLDRSYFSLLNGSDPPIITPSASVPADVFQLDTPMITHFGRRVVREREPGKIMQSYAGWDPVTFKENFVGTGLPPGVLYDAKDSIPMSIYLKEPDGTPLFQVENGVVTQEFDRYQTIDRLPVVPVSKSPPPIGTVSRGTSLWLDFNGVALRFRNSQGLAPPLFASGINGTYNAKLGVVPPSKDGQVITGSGVLNKPAHHVTNTGAIPFFDPGLCVAGPGPYPAFNDIKVDAPEVPELGLENAISDNATVTLLFQGAFPIRAGSHVPDSTTLTGWVSDLRELSGYPLIRFQVAFDLSADVNNYPFGVGSFRPAVDRVRIRTKY